MKARYAGDPSMRISHECLYQWIYAKPQRALDLRQYLARGRKRRTRKKGRKDIPPAARVDRTWDNGTEASLHMLVDEALGMLTYFADPYSSWQRGSNENRNGRIRRYLPKGTGFGDLAQEDLDAIVGEINDTPMKLLGYKTPNEVWDEEIAKLQSKAASPNTSVALTN